MALAFLELMQPRLHECVAQLVQAGHERIIIAPMFLAQGGHLKEDLPRLIGDLNACHSSVEISVLPAIGEVHNLLEAIAQSLVEGLPRADR